MTRNARTLLVMLFSVSVAGVASYSAYRTLEPAPATASAPEGHVAVAARALPIGTRLTADDVKLVAWAATPLPGSFGSVDALVGRTVVAALVPHEPLIDGKLASKEAGAGLPPAIPAGMRAISVKVNEVIGVAGFVAPGNHVDVLLTVRAAQDGRARVVVSDVRVLAAGTRQEQEREGGTPATSTVVTLLATPENAERIALASTEGQIMLALRNPFDRNATVTPGVALSAMVGGEVKPAAAPAALRPRAAAAPAPVAAPYVVEAIRGAKRTEEVVR